MINEETGERIADTHELQSQARAYWEAHYQKRIDVLERELKRCQTPTT